MTPCPFIFPTGERCRLRAGHDAGPTGSVHNGTQPPDRANLELTVPEPEQDTGYRRTRRGDWGCGVLPFLAAVLAFLALLAGCSARPAGNATPSAAPDTTAFQGQRGAPHGVSADRPVASAGQPEPDRLGRLGDPVMMGRRGAPPPPLQLAGGTAISHGIASWYAARGDQGAVPWWKPGQEPLWAVVSRFADGRTYSVTVLITGWCGCLQGQPGARVIDLSDGAFRQLAPLSVGLIRVTVELSDAGPGLPATSTKEGP